MYYLHALSLLHCTQNKTQLRDAWPHSDRHNQRHTALHRQPPAVNQRPHPTPHTAFHRQPPALNQCPHPTPHTALHRQPPALNQRPHPTPHAATRGGTLIQRSVPTAICCLCRNLQQSVNTHTHTHRRIRTQPHTQTYTHTTTHTHKDKTKANETKLNVADRSSILHL